MIMHSKRYNFKTEKIAAWFLLCVAFLCSCRENEVVIYSPEKDHFVNQCNTPGYYVAGAAKFVYQPFNHQYSSNLARKLYRIQTNQQDSCLNVVMETIPSDIGVHIMTTIDYFDPETRESITLLMECSKFSSSKIWLWDSEAKRGIIL